ncbi:unnamed protein product [Meloidogyne enterolobii]|uniref:Uncharacterized protein n=1 Tax=Meloidogyne enterolobii TaxID=390850 RepID=A0ACB0ZHQ4_MELEN
MYPCHSAMLINLLNPNSTQISLNLQLWSQVSAYVSSSISTIPQDHLEITNNSSNSTILVYGLRLSFQPIPLTILHSIRIT